MIGGAKEFEERYPPLDLAPQEPNPEYVGVTLLRRGIHLSKPKNWLLRDASNQPGQAYVGYVSPNAYSFAIYERPEYAGTLAGHAEALRGRRAGRGREDRRQARAGRDGHRPGARLQRRTQRTAAKRPLTSHSREYLLRGESRVVIVQVVYEGDDLSQVNPELLRVIDTLEVL